MISVLIRLPKHEKIILKIHNANDKGNWISGNFWKYDNFIQKYKIPEIIIRKVIQIISSIFNLKIRGDYLFKYLPKIIKQIILKLQNLYIYTRCENLLSNYPNFGAEVFMNGIRKGLITGISACVLDAIDQEVPIYMCESFDDYPESSLSKLVKEYSIPLEFGKFVKVGINVIDKSTNKVDLIKYLMEESKQ